MEISKVQLENVLEESRSRETSSDPQNRNEENKSRFQCTATALNIQELFGGRLLRQDVILHDPKDQDLMKKKKVPHFFNEIGGKAIDLTTDQLEKIGEISRENHIKIVDEKLKDAMLDMFSNIQNGKEILGKNIKHKLMQLFQISLDDLEKYLETEKIKLIS